MSKMIKLRLISVWMAFAAVAAAQPPAQLTTTAVPMSDSLESVANAFIATYAKENVAWKKDIRLTSTPREVPAGRQVGLSAYAGYYTFLPKLWSELSAAERHGLLKDPRLKAFIISLAHPATYPANGAAQSPARRAPQFDPTKPAFPVSGVGNTFAASELETK